MNGDPPPPKWAFDWTVWKSVAYRALTPEHRGSSFTLFRFPTSFPLFCLWRRRCESHSVTSWPFTDSLWMAVYIIWSFYFFFLSFFFFGHPRGIWIFPDQGISNLSWNWDLRYSCSNAGSLTHCSGPGVSPAPPTETSGIINLLRHRGNSLKLFKVA